MSKKQKKSNGNSEKEIIIYIDILYEVEESI